MRDMDITSAHKQTAMCTQIHTNKYNEHLNQPNPVQIEDDAMDK